MPHAWRLTGLAVMLALLAASGASAVAETRGEPPPIRARDLGVPFEGVPGRWNAITDVVGLRVGHATVIDGDGALKVGEGPVRTGVTAILPLGGQVGHGIAAGVFALNGAGEMTGAQAIEETGLLFGPVLLTNTMSVGTVRDAAIEWEHRRAEARGLSLASHGLPVVAESWDGRLNDIYGFHVRKGHAVDALERAQGGPVTEGSVGAGTGAVAFDFKAGIGTASRVVGLDVGDFVVGVLVQANFGRRQDLVVGGVPLGRELAGELLPQAPSTGGDGEGEGEPAGSAVVVIATDAPLLPVQLKRLARHAALGLARTGSRGDDRSPDLFLAFSTATWVPSRETGLTRFDVLWNMDPLFSATIEAVEEAIVNSLVAADTMTGIDGRTVHALPWPRLREILAAYGRLDGAPPSVEPRLH